jgi:predicted hydrocarbon binding protein
MLRAGESVGKIFETPLVRKLDAVKIVHYPIILIYDHPNSFELEPLEGQTRSMKPICHFNAGYSAGWCTESFGVPLEAREIMCKATGAKTCRFVMAHRDRIMDHLTKQKIQEYIKLR